MHAIEGSSRVELAAKLLIAPTTLIDLTRLEAFTVVSYMAPRKIAMGATFIRQVMESDTGCMILLQEGAVIDENTVVSRIAERLRETSEKLKM